jgi:hypothetical protein
MIPSNQKYEVSRFDFDTKAWVVYARTWDYDEAFDRAADCAIDFPKDVLQVWNITNPMHIIPEGCVKK